MPTKLNLNPAQHRRARRALRRCQRVEDRIATGLSTRAALASVSRTGRVPQGTLRSWYYKWRASGRLFESLLDARYGGAGRPARWQPDASVQFMFHSALLDPRIGSMKGVVRAIIAACYEGGGNPSERTMMRYASALLTPSQHAELRRLWRLRAITRGIERRLGSQLSTFNPQPSR